DGCNRAHAENTIAIAEAGPRALTAVDCPSAALAGARTDSLPRCRTRAPDRRAPFLVRDPCVSPSCQNCGMSFTCTECGYSTVQWLGRCPECQAWGTLEEKGADSSKVKTKVKKSSGAKPINEVDSTLAQAKSTFVPELDRVLGGGIVPGAVVLLSGEPGVGKSTLLLDVAAKTALFGAKVLYVTGEESAGQVRLRAERINALADSLLLAAE